jgi:hypothetical protein
VDTLTKLAFVVLGLLTAGTVWWYVADELRQRRRARAEVWARQQMSPVAAQDKPPTPQRADDPTVPLDLWPTEELEDPPELVRPYLWMQEQTEVFPRVQGRYPKPPDS